MDKRRLFTLAAVLAAVLATLAALTTVSRAVGKIDPDLYHMLKSIFLKEALPALALGLALIGLAVFLSERHRWSAIILLVVAPVAAMLLGMALLG